MFKKSVSHLTVFVNLMGNRNSPVLHKTPRSEKLRSTTKNYAKTRSEILAFHICGDILIYINGIHGPGVLVLVQ